VLRPAALLAGGADAGTTGVLLAASPVLVRVRLATAAAPLGAGGVSRPSDAVEGRFLDGTLAEPPEALLGGSGGRPSACIVK
jgi:hypothetical protein